MIQKIREYIQKYGATEMQRRIANKIINNEVLQIKDEDLLEDFYKDTSTKDLSLEEVEGFKIAYVEDEFETFHKKNVFDTEDVLVNLVGYKKSSIKALYVRYGNDLRNILLEVGNNKRSMYHRNCQATYNKLFGGIEWKI